VFKYKVLSEQQTVIGNLALRPVQPEEIEKIRVWRNEQIDALRQKVEISKEDQIEYFKSHIWPTFDADQPKQILLSIYLDSVQIGYGGIVHIAWEHSRAEVSFLLDSSVDETSAFFKSVFKNFLKGVEKIATESLRLNKLTLETYDFRKNHVDVLESEGYLREGNLNNHVLVNGKWCNSILHGKILDDRRSVFQQINQLKNILVSSSSKKAPLIRALQKDAKRIDSGIKIIAGDSSTNVVSRFVGDLFWEMPMCTDSKVDEILKTSLDLNIGLIIPTRDGELEFWARHRDLFNENGITVLISSVETVQICLDKMAFFKKMEQFGFNVISTSLELSNSKSDELYVVKENFGSGSKGLGTGLNTIEAKAFASNLSFPIYQPMVVGKEISADVWIIPGFFESVVLRSRDLVIEGESQITTVFHDPVFEGIFLSMAQKLNIVGPAVFQAIIDECGELNIIECNARFGGASTAAIAAGSNSLENTIIFYITGVGECLLSKPQDLRILKQVRTAFDEYFYDFDF
jgi:carbamoyl-phosphate synthase large subunit